MLHHNFHSVATDSWVHIHSVFADLLCFFFSEEVHHNILNYITRDSFKVRFDLDATKAPHMPQRRKFEVENRSS
jgi:hypothetical protein